MQKRAKLLSAVIQNGREGKHDHQMGPRSRGRRLADQPRLQFGAGPGSRSGLPAAEKDGPRRGRLLHGQALPADDAGQRLRHLVAARRARAHTVQGQALSGRDHRARRQVRAQPQGPGGHLLWRQGRQAPAGVHLRARRRRQQDRAAGARGQRLLRQHRPLGREERLRGGHRPAPSRAQLGRRRARSTGSRPTSASTTATARAW
jgi:hypothetical protein